MNYNFPFDTKIAYDLRKAMMGQEPRLIWLTGLPGSGKTTLALRLEHYLFNQGYKSFLLDGDNVRMGLNKDLGFSEEDRKENLRRVGESAKLMLDSGLIVISAFISPYNSARDAVKAIVGENRFIEIYVNCPLHICEERDVKGLYQKARKGIVLNFTGISSPYQAPATPDVEVKTSEETIEASLLKIINHIAPLISS